MDVGEMLETCRRDVGDGKDLGDVGDAGEM